jgi:Lon protease-like protein
MVRLYFYRRSILNSVIPIFPLNIVVFPSSKIPLHIFEEKYKKLINQCLGKKEGFGIVAKIGDEISKVGCYVEVSKVLQRYSGGELDIIVTGRDRFLVKETSKHPYGYSMASVEAYNDTRLETDESLLNELEISFENILGKAQYKLEDSFWKLYHKTTLKSFKIAEKSGLTLEQQQKLLNIRKEIERINFLLDHFKKMEIKLTENAALKALIMGDGYLNL